MIKSDILRHTDKNRLTFDLYQFQIWTQKPKYLNWLQQAWDWSLTKRRMNSSDIERYVCCCLPPCSFVLFLSPTVIQPRSTSAPSEVFTKGVRREEFGHCVSWTQTKSSKNKLSSMSELFLSFSSWAKFSAEVRCLFLLAMTYHSWGTRWTPDILARCCSAWFQHPTNGTAGLHWRTCSGGWQGTPGIIKW